MQRGSSVGGGPFVQISKMTESSGYNIEVISGAGFVGGRGTRSQCLEGGGAGLCEVLWAGRWRQEKKQM